MTTLTQAAARVLLPLAFGAFVFTSAALADPEIEDVKDYCGEINQIVTESQGWLLVNAQNLYDKKTLCQKLVLSVTNQALKDTAATGMVYRTAKELGKALKELASTIGLPGEVNLEKALEKGLDKLNDAAKKKAKEELEKALKKLAGEHDPAGYRYTKEGKVNGCDYKMVVTWNINEQTFLIRTTGDCHCKEISSNEGKSKLGKWQSTIKGVAKINAKFGAGELVIGLDVTPESYSGAGQCNCGKNDISLPEDRTENISLPETPVEIVSLPEPPVEIVTLIVDRDHLRDRDRDRDRDRLRDRDRDHVRDRDRKRDHVRDHDRKRDRTVERRHDRGGDRAFARKFSDGRGGMNNRINNRGMGRMASAGGMNNHGMGRMASAGGMRRR
jgi:hypothetical protein